MTEIIARRQFLPLYIWLDIAFLIFFAALLLIKKKYMTVIVGAVMGAVYMAVDYGVFHLICHSRSISGGSLFWVLLWMSVSYGFTNFAWIWLWLSKDENLFEWSLMILVWWFACPMLTSTFSPANATPIVIERTTGAYHGWMALILVVGYFAVGAYNVLQKNRDRRVNIPWIFAIGVLAQLGWETALLLGGIRSAGFASATDKLTTLVVNSLLETNLGMPYVYLIFVAVTARFTERLTRRNRPPTLLGRIEEDNRTTVRKGTAQ